ncbi:MAG: maleylpyruvate isomerase N-terminal domain-containing protein [Actinomycetota bacterium]|nr:maleylpyruvate isomerase N-terminal domain-containing protein [Actinomycetota bacterium]
MAYGALFLDLARIALGVLESDDVASRWNTPSVLIGYEVSGLAGHLARAVLVVEDYLDAPEPPEGREPIAAADYFVVVLGHEDPIASEFHASVRRRGAETAAGGPESLVARTRGATARLGKRLPEIDTSRRRVQVLMNFVLPLEEYLRTRLVELVVHLDDLAVSLDRPGPELPEVAYRHAAGVLGEVAALRAGGLATVRSLARAERHPQPVRAL